jgi:hypothetical protein
MPRKLTRWTVPGFFLGVGIVCLVAAGAGDRIVEGVVILAVMAACALAIVLLARRSETCRGLTREPDERFALISERAWAGTGFVLTIANLYAFVGHLATGHTGSPYYWYLGTAAVAYIAFVALFRRVS